MDKSFYNLMEQRRSIYAIDNKISQSEEEVKDLIKQALKYCPTAFNSQSGRILALFNDSNQKFWNLTYAELTKVAPAAKHAELKAKINSFAAGFGTVLFFEDEVVVHGLEKQYPAYKERFADWSLQSSGMLQFALWCLFANNKIGASLQHYSPLVENFIYDEFKLPLNWKLNAQMPFGRIVSPADEKTFVSLDSRFKTAD